MKTIIKIIWFSLAITLRKYFVKFITIENVGLLRDKLNTYSPLYDLSKIDLQKIMPDLVIINNVVLFTILFLGLDIISGEITGILKGPFKLILNAIMYLIGFTIIFFIIDNTIMVSY